MSGNWQIMKPSELVHWCKVLLSCWMWSFCLFDDELTTFMWLVWQAKDIYRDSIDVGGSVQWWGGGRLWSQSVRWLHIHAYCDLYVTACGTCRRTHINHTHTCYIRYLPLQRQTPLALLLSSLLYISLSLYIRIYLCIVVSSLRHVVKRSLSQQGASIAPGTVTAGDTANL